MRNKRQSGLHSLISNWRRRRANQITAAAGHCHRLYRRCTQCQSLDAGISTRADAGTTRLYAGEVARRVKRQPKPGKRHDIIQLGGENLAAGLNGESLFLFAGDQKDADAIYANPLLAHLPAVQNKQVYALGTETFRLDYYSAMQVLDRLKALF